MLDYEDVDLQTPVESKEDETRGNTIGRGFFGLSPGPLEMQTVGESQVSPPINAAFPSPTIHSTTKFPV